MWREKFSIAQITRIPIFRGCVDEWNSIQRQFVSWCVFYYNIFKMDEPPSINIIEDDRLLDSFLKARELKIKHDKMKQDAETKTRPGGKHTHEVFK